MKEEFRRVIHSATQNIKDQRALHNVNIEPSKEMVIAFDEANRCCLYGDLIMACIMIPKNFFIKHKLKVKDSKVLSRIQRDMIFEKSKGLMHWAIRRITPLEMETGNLNDLEMKAIISMLNEIPKFWEHTIIVDNFEIDKDHFVARFQKLLSVNLQKLDLDLNKKNWKIEHRSDLKYKPCSLASVFARYHWDQDLEYLHNSYGKEVIGSGSPSDKRSLSFISENIGELPSFIRRSFSPTKELIK